MSRSKVFPIFACHHSVRCFNCSAVVVEHRLEDLASGAGQYSAHCVGGCGMRTWYDLWTDQPEKGTDHSPVR